MDPRTLELFRSLQSGPYDEAAWKQIQRLLIGQRRALRGRNDVATLAEIVQLLEAWAQAANTGRLRSVALGEAAEIAERELRQVSLADDLRGRAVAEVRSALERNTHAHPVGSTAAVTMAVEQVADTELDEAIAACEAALDVEATPANVQALADLYARRATPADCEQAAELYCMLGDVLGNPEGIAPLKRALELAPGHADAEALLARFSAEIRASVPTITLNMATTTEEGSTRKRRSTLQGTPSPAPLPQPPEEQARLFEPHAPKTPPGIGASASAAPALNMKASPLGVPAALGHSAAAALHAAPPAPLSAFATGAQPSLEVMTAELEQPVAPPRLSAAAVRPAAEPPPLPVPEAPPPLAATPALAKMPSGSRAPVMMLQLPAGSSGAPLRVMPVSSLSPVVIDEAEPDVLPPSHVRRWARPAGLVALALSAAAASLLLVRSIGSNPASPPSQTHAVGQAEAAKPAAPEPPPPPPAPAPAAVAPERHAPPAPPPKAAAPRELHEAHASVELLLDHVVLQGGKLTPQQLASAIDKAQSKLEACYGQTLARKPHLKGKLQFSFTIKPNGKASIAKLAGGTIKDAALIQCSADVISNAKFPKPRKQAVKVKLALQYKPS